MEKRKIEREPSCATTIEWVIAKLRIITAKSSGGHKSKLPSA